MLKRREFLKSAGQATAATLICRAQAAADSSNPADAAQFAEASGESKAASRKPLAPIDLLVNGVSNPLAIDRRSTRFTWRSPANGRGEMQSAYQILVASNPANLATGTADQWDSGKINSINSASVEYAGEPLPPAKRLWWKVRIWNQSGKPGPYSASAFFHTGLNPGEWKAQYIWDGTTTLNNFAYFRKTFSAARKPRLAKVYVSAHNDYMLWLNGVMLGRGPARSDPYHYGQYNGFDVTAQVRPGTNVFAAIGHWQGSWHDSGVNAEPAFLLEAHLGYDGESSTIVSDASWKTLAHTPYLEDDAVYFGGAGGAKNRAAIRYDSRLEPKGWKSVDFDDSEWESASVVDRSGFVFLRRWRPSNGNRQPLRR